MAHGLPDYTVASDIASQSIGNLAVDIDAQTIGNLGVDLAAQSVGNLAVDIVAQTLATMGVDIKAQSIGNLGVDLVAQSVGNIGVNVLAWSVGNIGVDIAALSVGNVGVDIAALSVGSLDIDITAQTIGNLAIDITAQTIDRMYILPKAPSSATTIYKSGNVSGSTTVLHTVTAGKTFYLTTGFLATSSVAINRTGYLAVRNGSDVIQYYLAYTYLRGGSLESGDIPPSLVVPITINPALAIPAGWDIVIYSQDSNITSAGGIGGWEE